jgi:hypothetical protein
MYLLIPLSAPDWSLQASFDHLNRSHTQVGLIWWVEGEDEALRAVLCSVRA